MSGILKEQSCIKLTLNRILSKIDGNSIGNSNEQPLSLDGSFLSKFPMTNFEEFMLVENCILNESDFVPKLVRYNT